MAINYNLGKIEPHTHPTPNVSGLQTGWIEREATHILACSHEGADEGTAPSKMEAAPLHYLPLQPGEWGCYGCCPVPNVEMIHFGLEKGAEVAAMRGEGTECSLALLRGHAAFHCSAFCQGCHLVSSGQFCPEPAKWRLQGGRGME